MSKRLVLLRHGHAAQLASDYERPLSAHGERTATRVGEDFASRGLRFERVLSSTANRAYQTAQRVLAACQPDLAIDGRRELYLAAASTAQRLLQELPDEVQSVLLVGHNPGLSELASALWEEGLAFAPGEYADRKFEIERWRDL